MGIVSWCLAAILVGEGACLVWGGCSRRVGCIFVCIFVCFGRG